MSDPGLIQLTKYVTQVGQLRRVSRNQYGDTAVTTTQTINCLVYLPHETQEQVVPINGQTVSHLAIFANTITATIGDHLTTVVDVNGGTVLADARVIGVKNYHHWKHGTRFKQMYLTVDLV